MPKITVLLPTRQSEAYLRETLESVFSQNFTDYELLVVDDGSTDGTLDILESYHDSRTRIIEGRNEGLASALNLGLTEAKGEYVARIDADDRMAPGRLEKQTRFLDEHLNVAVCGGWQRHFGLSTFVHKPPQSMEQCKANLLFRCDLCHSTLMLRKKTFLENHLFYDGHFAAEDFELWTRVVDYGGIANLPEVLTWYREDGKGITDAKKRRLIEQNGEIVAATLQRNLKIELTNERKGYFTGWSNPFPTMPAAERKEKWEDLRDLLYSICVRNRKAGYYDEEALLRAVEAEWERLRYNVPFELPNGEISLERLFRKRSGLSALAQKGRSFCRNYRGIYRKYRKLRRMLFEH